MSAAPEWVTEGQYLPRLRDLIQIGWGLPWFSRRYGSWEPREVMLPSCSILSTGHFTHFPAVCTPKILGDLEDVVALYEEYVNRGLGRVRRPELALVKFFRDERVGLNFAGRGRQPTEWWEPLVKVLVLASRISGRVLTVAGWGPTGTVVSLDLGGYYMEVRHWGAFSNTESTMHHASVNATDVSFDGLKVPRLFTSHPLAVALDRLGAHRDALQLANLAIRADAGRRKPLLDPATLFAPPARRVPRQPRKVDAERLRVAEGFRGLFEESYSIDELRELLVPRLMTATDFREVIGREGREVRDRWGGGAEARPTARAAQRFETYLDNLSMEP